MLKCSNPNHLSSYFQPLRLDFHSYFDNRRRNDPAFRKELNKDKKRNAKALKRDAKANEAAGEARLQDALNQVKDESYPQGVEEKEK